MEPGLLDGLATTRAIRRYSDEPVTDDQLAQIMFAASRAPSGSNRQLFRFVVLRDEPESRPARELIASAAQELWTAKRKRDKYDRNADTDTPKARMAASMDHYVENLADAPVLVFPCLIRHRDPNPYEGASVYPAMQNLLLGARAIGLGGVVTIFHSTVEPQLRAMLSIPDNVFIAATVTLGHPVGNHGPVRRRPIREMVYGGTWGQEVDWAIDPEGTAFTSAGPPKA